MQNESSHLSVVIPAYNEEQRIGASLEKIVDYLAQQTYSYEILVVEDGSTDGTLKLCRTFSAKYPRLRALHHETNHGKGCAVRNGMLAAEGEYILFCDADLATPIEELDGFWPHMEQGADIVIASRALRSSHLEKRQPIYREMAGRTFNLAVRALAVRGIHDTQCGFKLFKRDAARSVFSLCMLDDFGFDFEVLHIAQRLGFRIHEAPVHWYHRPGSKVKLLRDGFRMLADLIRIRLRHRGLTKQG